MITASVGVGSSLLLEPARELLFSIPDITSTHRPRSNLTLSNLSPLNDVVFRVRTRNPDAFTVHPTHGLVPPGASVLVTITATARTCERLSAMDPRDLMTRQSSELFLVQSVEREEEVQAMEPLDVNSSTSLGAFWKKVPRDSVTENKMVCRFTGATPGVPPTEITQDRKMFSRSMSNASSSSQEYRSSRSENRSLSMSARENRLSRSGSSSDRSLNLSFSNQFTPPEETREQRNRQDSFNSDASFHTTIEPPMMDRKMSALTNNVAPATERRSEARMSSSSNATLSRPPMTRQRDTNLTSISVSNSSVSDTMLTTLSSDATPSEPTHELGPLLYHIQPSDTLSFNVKPAPRFWSSTSLFIVNSSQSACLTFKVRTTNQSGYVVKPSRGLVSTTSAQEVVVSLCTPRDENSFDPEKRESKDGFMIEVANISRDQYLDLMKLDEHKRTREISSLWSLMPRSDRESTMLSVEFKMDNSDCGSSTLESFESDTFDRSSSEHKNRSKAAQRQSLHSVVQGRKELSTSSSTDESHESVAGGRLNSIYSYSDSEESAFTIAPSAVPTEVGDDDNNKEVVYPSASKASKNSAVIVVSADRMDTVDFSNPKLSFFI
ncbi:MSP (Major sperm protein) domain [Phytophthora infestans]|uniref:MSP (Major sperm protein) domain n=1 Tax=Phytophthora infestans TaxID=4787 RepID=A0A833SRD0_PHYIN|nr:MSP (Major sperm protein) domain [Phytophthora infestans]